MIRKLTAMALLLSVVATAGGQTIYEAAGIVNKDLNGTARFVGMGGAMGALGGDISTISTNPAGIGIYRSNDAMLSFGFSAYGTESNYLGNKSSSDNTRGSFDNIGFVLATKIGNATPLRYVNVGFNYRKAKSFYRNTRMGGDLGGFSQTQQMAGQAAGLTNWGSSPFEDSGIGWLSALGYEGYLITDLMSQSELDGILQSNPDYDNYEPYTVNGRQVTNLQGELMYRTPGEYIGMYSDGMADFRSEERGGIDEYDLNISFNINDRVYLGLTAGIYSVDYAKNTQYSEDYGNQEGYTLNSYSRIDGTGFDIKMGAIIRPFEYSPLRIGLAVHTPTFYKLDYTTGAYLQSDVLNYLDVENEVGIPSGNIGLYDIDTYDILGQDMVRSFQLRTPWLYNVSLGYTVGSSLALGAEYEYQDYSSIEFKDYYGYTDSFQPENESTSWLKGVHTVRVGAEYKVVPQFAFRVGYNYSSGIFENYSYKSLPINSIQTDTDFANSESKNDFTVGIGYRGALVYADLTYKYTSCKADFYPFDMYDGQQLVQATRLSNTRSQVLFTLGCRF